MPYKMKCGHLALESTLGVVCPTCHSAFEATEIEDGLCPADQEHLIVMQVVHCSECDETEVADTTNEITDDEAAELLEESGDSDTADEDETGQPITPAAEGAASEVPPAGASVPEGSVEGTTEQ
jgi:hypothetical protein